MSIMALLGIAYLIADATDLARWAADWQRSVQNEMAGAIHALRAGAPGALIALLVAAGAYGFFHAVGPGHGKYLIGGAGLGTRVPMARLIGIAVASSLAQALSAILLVYGGFSLLELTAPRMTTLAENYLAPASYIAVAAIGAVFIWRGGKALTALSRPLKGVSAEVTGGHSHPHSHDKACGCHAHGASPQDVAALKSLRDALMLVGSIAIRPCTGAIFLLVIAWQMEIRGAGALAVIVMGLGTAALTSLVAASSIAARSVAFASVRQTGGMALAMPSLQILAGATIIWISLLLFGNAVV